MSPLETPPNASPVEPQEKTSASSPKPLGNRLTTRYQGLDQHELIYLLDEVDDERARARFREAIYISVIFWFVLGAILLYGPRYLWKQPRLVVATEEPRKDHLSVLDLPPDVARKLAKPRPTPNVAQRNQESQSPKPGPQAPMPKRGNPGPTAPQPQPTPQPQAPQQQAQQQPQPQQPQRQQPAPRPQQTPLVDSPTPAPTRPNFSSGQSAGQQIQQAARNAARGGEGGDYGVDRAVQQGGTKVGTQILSDTQGVDFARYLSRLLADVKRNWLPLIPEECRPPLNKKGITGVRFTILPDGKIATMHLDYSTHDVAIDRAAWGSITGLGQAQPLPPEFHGPNLELRIEFQINQDPR